MGTRGQEPSTPLDRAAVRRAGEVDEARTPAERRRAWGRLAPPAAGSFFETVGRVWMVNTAVGASFLLILTALVIDTGAAPRTAGVAAGVVGVVLTWGALWRRVDALRQWVVAVAVLLVAAGGIMVLALTSAGGSR